MSEAVIWKGTLEKLRFPDLLLHISRRKETGVLHITQKAIEKSFYFQDGKIIFARSSDQDERLGVLLLRRDKITCRQLEECIPKVTSGKRLGTVLVLEGYIQPDDLYHGVVDQIKEIIYTTFEWQEGDYRFDSGEVPTNEVITLNLSTPDIVLAGIARIWRWSWIKKGILSLDTVFRKKDGWSPIARKMTLTTVVEQVLELLDRPRTLEEILQESPLGDFETCKLLWAFLIVGLAEEILVAPDWASAETAPQTAEMAVPIVENTQPELSSSISVPAMLDIAELPIAQELDIQQSELSSALANSENSLNESASDAVSFADLADLSDTNRKADTAPVKIEAVTLPGPDTTGTLERDLNRFNEKQRFIYEMIRLDLGEQAANFLTKVFLKATARYPLVFEGVSVNDFGEFSLRLLSSNIEMNLVKNYWEALDYLLQEQREMVAVFLDGKRSQAFDSGLERIEKKYRRV